MKTPKPRKMKYESKWYVAEMAKHTRFMNTPLRPCTPNKQSGNNDSKAKDYARWILQRDGFDIAAAGEAFRAAHNAANPPTGHTPFKGSRTWTEANADAIPDDLEMSTRVEYDFCAAGYRPRYVHFEFSQEWRDGWRQQRARTFGRVHTVELPHWSIDVDQALLSSDIGEPTGAFA